MKLLGYEQNEIVRSLDTPGDVALWVAADDPEAYAFSEADGPAVWLVESAEDVRAHKMLYMCGTDDLIPADFVGYEFVCALPGGEWINMTIPGSAAYFIPRRVMDECPGLWTEFHKVSEPEAA